MEKPHHAVLIGGGFGGLLAAQSLKRAPVQVTLIDRRNFHLFQPLLYQVATGGLSPANIATPLRGILKRQRNVRVLLDEVTDIDAAGHRVLLRDGDVHYDTLVVATGAQHHYFGHPQWETVAPGLKTIEDATEIRRRILLAFEEAERESDPEKTRFHLTFVVVGGGPTGVELAGALGEIANDTLKNEFRSINPADARILLLEGNARILPTYPADLSSDAVRSLAGLGVTVQTNAVVTEINEDSVRIRCGNEERKIPTRTVLWAAGVAASPLGRRIASVTGALLDKVGRVVVEPDLTIKGHPEIFVIGDLANFSHQTGTPLPGVAPVAIQQGRYVAKVIARRLRGETMPPFAYRDKGSLATIGRAAAVADLGRVRYSGYFAWLTWLFIHLMYIVEFENRLLVFVQWAWNYFTRNRAARLITGKDALPPPRNTG
ncbi:MAG: NAD(P)/FAD-dependent oxidoreductase [Acidobacteriia bacterium]|nr:NAD(P)/FAD-dependent oxidoreductase [Terriglobia bacterium]